MTDLDDFLGEGGKARFLRYQQILQQITGQGLRFAELPISQIEILEDGRNVEPDKLEASLRELKQQVPIVVLMWNGRYFLVFGRRRVEALKRKGNQTVRVQVYEAPESLSESDIRHLVFILRFTDTFLSLPFSIETKSCYIRYLREEFGLKLEEIHRLIGGSLSISTLSRLAREIPQDGFLARIHRSSRDEILDKFSDEKAEEIAEICWRKKLSKAQVREFVNLILQYPHAPYEVLAQVTKLKNLFPSGLEERLSGINPRLIQIASKVHGLQIDAEEIRKVLGALGETAKQLRFVRACIFFLRNKNEEISLEKVKSKLAEFGFPDDVIDTLQDPADLEEIFN